MRTFITCLLLAAGSISTAQAEPYLFSTEGIYTHPITTKSPTAQQYFDQGMIFYYGYNFEEAARSFQEAAKIDPDCAMCYWGIALASRSTVNQLQEQNILQNNARKAEQLMSKATPQEQAYIKVLVNSYPPNSHSFNDLDRTFMAGMKDVSKQYPQDADAAALYSYILLNNSDDMVSVKRSIKDALAIDPKHPGANHYLIHALDATSEPNEGVASAKTLETLIPFAGHLLHMPANIYFKLGKYSEATEATTRAMKADEDLFAKGGVKGIYFSASLTMEGKENEALQVLQRLNEIIEQGKPTPSIYMDNALSIQRLLILQRYEEWDQILKMPKPETPLGNGMWHYTRALAYLAQNDLPKAKAEASEIQNEQVDKSEDSLNTLMQVMSLRAQAAIDEKEGNTAQMLSNYQKAMKLEDEITRYFEPPLWFTSARESLGYALLSAGKRQEASKQFQDDLKLHPNKIWSMKGLEESK